MAINTLQDCWRSGITLSLQGDNISFKATPNSPLKKLLPKIKENKYELIELLKKDLSYFNARPLSANEKALWFLYRLDPNSTAYNMAYAIKLKPIFSLEQINKAFDDLLQAHPILMSKYGEKSGEPVQFFNEIGNTLNSILLIEKRTNASEESIQQWITTQADKPFVLEQGVNCTGAVLQNNCNGEIEYYFTLVIHHIAADFISFELLRNDFLSLLIGKKITNKELTHKKIADKNLPEHHNNDSYYNWLVKQYVEQYFKEASHQESEQFWVNSLADLPQLQLPTDFSHNQHTSSQGEEIQQILSSALSSQVKKSCQERGVTPYIWWMAAFQWFLARVSQQTDFVIGTPSSGRITAEDFNIVGYMVNPLALRCQINTAQSFDDWLDAIAKQTRLSMKHQAYPFATLIDKLELTRQAGRSPVFQHMFTLNHLHQNALSADAIEQEILAEQRGAAHELNLVIVDDRKNFTCKWRYNDGLYKRETVLRIQDMFIHMATQLVNQQALTFTQVSITPKHLQSTLSGDIKPVIAKSAWQSFCQQVTKKPNATAIQERSKVLTYQQLNQHVNEYANVLANKGFKTGDRLGITLTRSTAQIILMLASWRLGGSFIVLDNRWPIKRQKDIASNSNIALIALTENAQVWSDTPSIVMDKNNVNDPKFTDPDKTKNSAELKSIQLNNINLDNIAKAEAYVIYTSGSTGQAKGVPISQQNLSYYVSGLMNNLLLSEHASLTSLSAHSADLGYTALFGALLTGRCLRILDETLALDTQALVDELTNNPVDCLKIVPSHLNGLLLAAQSNAILPRQALICGGEGLTPELVERIRNYQPHLAIYNHYGPTEATIGALMYRLSNKNEKEIPIGQPIANTYLRVVDIYGQITTTGFSGELQLAGPTLSRGYLKQNLTQSLDNNKDKNSDNFYQADNKRWYRTGDRVVLKNGVIHYIGRTDFQVKIRGFRVDPSEIEYSLKQHFNDATVLNAPDDNSKNRLVAFVIGDNDQITTVKQLMPSVFPDHMIPTLWVSIDIMPLMANGKIDRQALLALTPKAVDTLPASEQCNTPRNNTERILLSVWTTLLTKTLDNASGTHSNKESIGIHDDFFRHGGDSIVGLQVIAKAKEQKVFLTPKQIFSCKTIAELAAVAKTPTSDIEQKLLSILGEVLNNKNIQVDDNFFTIGGDSILSLQVIAKARKQGFKLMPKDIFEHKTVALLAHLLVLNEEARSNTDASINQKVKQPVILPEQSFPLTPIQNWFFSQNQPAMHHWNQSILLSSTTSLDIKKLENSIHQLVKHHASLRLTFIQENGQWQQRYQILTPNTQASNDWLADIFKVHADVMTTEGVTHKVTDDLLEQYQSGFSISQGPLLRIVWFPNSKQLLLAAHHLIIDAVSWQILVDDLSTLYHTAQSVELASIPVEFHQWQTNLTKQRTKQTSQQKSLNIEKINYWQQQLSHTPLTDKNENIICNSSANTYGNSRHYVQTLTEVDTTALLTTSNEAYNTRIHELLLCVVSYALCQWFEQEKLTIELEGHGRETLDNNFNNTVDSELDLSRSCGWFTARYPQRFSLIPDLSARIIVVKEQLRNIPEHGLSYGLLRYPANNFAVNSGTALDFSSSLNKTESETKNPVLWGDSSLVSFNYLGQQHQKSDQTFILEKTLSSGMRAKNNIRPHILDINAMVIDGCLQIDWCYPEEHPQFSLIPLLAEEVEQQLINLINHCQIATNGRATASDFPEANISDAEFIDLLCELEN